MDELRARIEPLRQALLTHRIYSTLRSAPAMRAFMEYHVFAVWDFMSLLKALQREMTCVETPWLPRPLTLGTRLINEIVLGEESDSDGQEGFASHFTLYHRAMRQCGARTALIDSFITQLTAGNGVLQALAQAEIPPAIQRFVLHSFSVINSGDLCGLAAAFTFGREDLLPAVFEKIVQELNRSAEGGFASFLYYLERHIELDADEHGPMAARLMMALCNDQPDAWRRATAAAVAALESRLEMWDAIHAEICVTT